MVVCRQRRLVWQFSTGDLVLGTPTVDEASGTCFVGSVDRRMYALDLASGEQRWNVTTGGGIEGPATLAAGRLFFGSNDGSLYCLDAATGRQHWYVPRRVLNPGDFAVVILFATRQFEFSQVTSRKLRPICELEFWGQAIRDGRRD